MYNEEAVIPALVARLRLVLDSLGVPYEFVAVDDGSIDATAAVLDRLRASWPELRVIRLRRNSGHQAALTAGLHRAAGTWIVSIDADLQDPPEAIAEMLRLAEAENLDVVYGVRRDRSTDTRFKRHTAALYYRLMRRVVGAGLRPHAGDFRLVRREVVNVLRRMPERVPVYRLLIPSLGFPSGVIHYARERRAAGQTKYPLRKMVRLAWDSTADFTAAPLRLATWLGSAALLACLISMAFALSEWARGSTVPGWSSLFLAVLLFAAVQLICLGLLGEYVARIHRTLQNRPMFHVEYDTVDTSTDRAPSATRH
ncbi:glycosyltransferase family 2 protein [Actinoplanes sp. CA-252034]|uniref:glycosyltransferase family 2 protein n=1 Tax=Actinoplanes sp. CA-252034 TaxID=3239906 RepID=UPI003D979A61